MVQFYLLSVLLNALTGLVLVYATDFLKKNAEKNNYVPMSKDDDDFMFDSDPDDDSAGEDLFGRSFLDDMNFRFVLGLLTTFVGFVKLLASMGPYPVFDDFFPGLAGIVGGLIVLLEFIAVRRSDIILPEFIEDFCIAGRKIVGICCIAAAVLHFLLPKLIVV